MVRRGESDLHYFDRYEAQRQHGVSIYQCADGDLDRRKGTRRAASRTCLDYGFDAENRGQEYRYRRDVVFSGPARLGGERGEQQVRAIGRGVRTPGETKIACRDGS